MWRPGTADVPEEDRPYATDASRLKYNIAVGEERQAMAVRKFEQLVRHGLVVGDHDRLRPILALPSVSDREQERRRQTAQRVIDQYIYESSEDDATASNSLDGQRKKPRKGRLAKLKEALAKHETPSGGSQVDQRGPLTTPGIDRVMANSSVVTNEEVDSQPTLGFQKAMRN